MFAGRPDRDEHVAVLEEENARLRERIALLERESFGTSIVFPSAWMLAPAEQRFLAVLISHASVSAQQVLTALYHDRDEEPNVTVIESHFSKLRKKMRAAGFDLPRKTRFMPYSLPSDLRERVKDAARASQ